ncbi:MAG: hypothetical protein WC911_09725 [Thermoleophilia bacterium]
MEHREASIHSTHNADTPHADTRPVLETCKGNLAVFLSFLLIATLAYWSILNNTLIGDDYFYTVKAGELPLSGVWHLFSNHPSFVRPLPSLTLWLQYKLFAVEGTYSHLINIAFHAGNAYLLFWLLKKLRISAHASLVGSFMFLITPVAVEPVTWASGRFDLMSTFFILLATGLYLISVRNKSIAVYAGAIAAAFAAMLSKESAMILVILFPAIELLYNILREENGSKKIPRKKRLAESTIRLLVFYGLFAGYIAMRFAILGRLGGYKDVPFVAVPDLLTSAKTFWTFLSPVNSQFASRALLLGIGGFFLLLLIVSQGLVLFRWKSATSSIHKAWIFLVIFLFSTMVPVNIQLFRYGIGHDLKDSRELYIITMLALSLMMVGLLEFGWKKREWSIYASVAILLLAIPWLWGLSKNNIPWERSAVISNAIIEDTLVMLPDPPLESRIYYYGVPEWDGAYIFINALRHAVAERYGRKDLQIKQITSDEKDFDLNKTEDGYLFVYDPAQQKLILIHGPEDK